MYKYFTIDCSISGYMKKDYAEIISYQEKEGYELVSVIPIFKNKSVPIQYDFIFKRIKK